MTNRRRLVYGVRYRHIFCPSRPEPAGVPAVRLPVRPAAVTEPGLVAAAHASRPGGLGARMQSQPR